MRGHVSDRDDVQITIALLLHDINDKLAKPEPAKRTTKPKTEVKKVDKKRVTKDSGKKA